MSCLVLRSSAPSANTLWLNALNAFDWSGVNSSRLRANSALALGYSESLMIFSFNQAMTSIVPPGPWQKLMLIKTGKNRGLVAVPEEHGSLCITAPQAYRLLAADVDDGKRGLDMHAGHIPARRGKHLFSHICKLFGKLGIGAFVHGALRTQLACIPSGHDGKRLRAKPPRGRRRHSKPYDAGLKLRLVNGRLVD